MERKWWTLGAVCVATFMLLLDITVVNTALPAIQKDLGGSFTDLQWVIDAYALSLAALVLTAGSLADRLGRRRVFAIGLAIFSARLAALRAGARPDLPQPGPRPAGRRRRDHVRRLAGPGRPGVPRRARSAAWRWASTAPRSAIAVAIGPLVGGLLTDGLGWQWVFLINVPIGIAAIVVTFLKLRRVARPQRDPDRLGRASRPSRARSSCSSWRWSAATTRAGGAR